MANSENQKETGTAYALVLISLIAALKDRGMREAGSEYAMACHDFLETIIEDAETWNVPLAEIDLEGFNISDMLDETKRTR